MSEKGASWVVNIRLCIASTRSSVCTLGAIMTLLHINRLTSASLRLAALKFALQSHFDDAKM